ncbi:MAG TPA: hypothetical protein VMK82_08685 [Steroidobacteraceae bacterium]|nr:hypothetical protein [Steroidobacteraceae bacterium]
MPGKRNCPLHLVFAALMSAVVAGSAIAADQQPLEELDEIWVQGKRLSKSIADVEDDFFELYNKVNKKSDYDIYCGYMSLHPGSMIMTRTCTPAFLMYNTSVVTGYGSYGRNTPANVSLIKPSNISTGPTNSLLLMERRAAYAQNVLDVINSDERLLQKYMDLVGMYEELRQTQGRYRTALAAAGGSAAIRVSTWRSQGPRAP